MIHIFYGAGPQYIDITDEAARRCFDGERIYIPRQEYLRSETFSDPFYGVLKNIVVFRGGDGDQLTCVAYDHETPVRIELSTAEKRQLCIGDRREEESDRIKIGSGASVEGTSIDERIAYVHGQLLFSGGSLQDEWAEQKMVAHFLNPRAKVLELGANIGRNTLMISSILENERDLVTLECDPISVELLRNNRYANNFHFHIEPSALSYRKLIQRGWETIPSDVILPDYTPVQTITFEELCEKYTIPFDTIVADCEGALYFILCDNDKLMTGINMVILESDYRAIGQKQGVEDIFRRYELEKIHSEPLIADRSISDQFPDECVRSFFEVWARRP